jgi:hypothetical protein
VYASMKDSDDQRYDQSSLGEKVRKGYKLVDISKIGWAESREFGKHMDDL